MHNEPAWISERIESTLGMFLKPDEDGSSLFDKLGEKFGRSIKGGLMGHASGEDRHEKVLETRVVTALMDKVPELKIGMAALKEFGLGDIATPENMPALLQLADKYGLGKFLKGNSPGGSSSSVNYGGEE